MSSFRSTKLKIAVGYSLLLAMLIFSLVFVYHEMENLSTADNLQDLKTDSLLLLLHEKDRNTIEMLRVLNEANDSLLSASEIEEIISEQDSVITRHRVQNRVITKRDTLVTKPKKKGFFKRLGEVFVPSKKETALLVNTSLEFATDTILEPFAATDSLQYKIRMATRQKRIRTKKSIRRNSDAYQRMNELLTNRMDSLIKAYEVDILQRSRQEAELYQSVRKRSSHIIGGIAIGGVLLSAIFLMLVMRDITRKNRYRKQLEEANKRAEALLAAREKLMLTITHDFKAPLSSIIGYTELLSRLTEDERQRFYLDNMKSSSDHLLKLVSDLLDFHRLDLNKAEVNRVSFTPAQLFEEIAVSFRPIMDEKGLTLKCFVEPELSERYVSDPLRLRQIINNLLSNAVKFTEQGSVTLTAAYENSRLTIEITDTGKGIAAEDCERIFQEFTRLPGAQGADGFGLGLSIVHKLVTLLEGKIYVDSTLGEGSCFTVVVPLYPVAKSVCSDDGHKETETLPAEDRNAEEAGSAEDFRILLIDDDKIQLELTAAMLREQGIIAVCCQQLDELMCQLRDSTFDLLLTDIQMPAIDGFDLLRLLRASNIPQARQIPVIAVTARSEMDEAALREHGFTGCLHKPFTVTELISAIGIKQIMRNAADTSLNMPAQPSSSLCFSALTAFSGDDPEAARTIVRTFIEETAKNASWMKQALEHKDVDKISDMAHKILPLFTIINASDSLLALKWLETRRGSDFSDEVEQMTTDVLESIDKVIDAANSYLHDSLPI
ncbi:hybrid sensor histidine kinase/response regulator [Bacteroides pyogenes]|uniref:hybrid sensor histidine kinase/response regulator n=1 Tax=Bacteroides pyogenes TaxID=310300 RepID=UPI0011E493F0|nr:ATP-binding protein [Bacteroides pyogenes]MBR8708732.1 Sensor histidine kinase RcsC [Bacteroides pyogenes]MBR8717384.1 Sensor histidine kinase RcsC [Bacteroides pyogenes]MBR8746989.1 Sensor histidine kinase RcsC [Bacteroides pyogenes]MBR8757375.1 Sensor histidine kinase RcsC [Bacteroides pyogenes]MBR8780601.1 Sensor histidine kinase RcsC [Bacteroides pyogenes]